MTPARLPCGLGKAVKSPPQHALKMCVCVCSHEKASERSRGHRDRVGSTSGPQAPACAHVNNEVARRVVPLGACGAVTCIVLHSAWVRFGQLLRGASSMPRQAGPHGARRRDDALIAAWRARRDDAMMIGSRRRTLLATRQLAAPCKQGEAFVWPPRAPPTDDRLICDQRLSSLCPALAAKSSLAYEAHPGQHLSPAHTSPLGPHPQPLLESMGGRSGPLLSVLG